MASLSGYFSIQELSDAGALLVGGRVYTYAFGTTTFKTAYTDINGLIPHTYTSDGAGGQYIALNARGELPAPLYLATGSYDVALKRSDGSTVWTRRADPSGDTATLAIQQLAAPGGASLVGFTQASSGYPTSTVGRKLQQIISPRDAPWNAVGDGIANDTAALTLFFAASAGKDCTLENGYTYLVSAGFTLQSGTTYRGNSKIKLAAAANITVPVLLGTACIRTIIEGIEIDGNVDAVGMGTGTSYGIFLTGGAGNQVRNVYVHDTKNAGLRIDTEDGPVVMQSRFINCGRSGVTDNHGIMIGSSTGVCQNWLIQGCVVKNAYRKGITTYGFAPGTCINGRIIGNHVSNCPLGGIYIAGDVGTIVGVVGVSISNNVSVDNYVNYEIANCSVVVCSGNDSHYTNAAPVTVTFTAPPLKAAVSGMLSTNWVGATGPWNVNFVETVSGLIETRSVTLFNGATTATWTAPLAAACNAVSAGLYAGWAIEGAQNINIVGGVNDLAPVHGVVLASANSVNCLNVSVRGMTITRANSTGAATGAGVQITNSTFCIVEVDISDSVGRMTHGILEGAGGDNNDIGGSVRDGTSARFVLASANTRARNRTGKNSGINTPDPLNTLDLTGGLTIREQAIALTAGANQNVTLPLNAGLLVSNVPGAAYSIGGIAGGHSGRRLTLINYTIFAMTLTHQDIGSTLANRFTLSGSVNSVISSLGSVELFYSPTMGAWTKLS